MKFVLFSPLHFLVLALTVLLSVALALTVRAATARGAAWLCRGWAVLLLGLKLAVLGWELAQGGYEWRTGLPMHLCDWTFAVAFVALIWRKRLAFELTYFWGVAGTTQAMVTPDLSFTWPDLRFVFFFATHAGVLVAVALLTFGLRMRPEPRSILRAFVCLQVYLVVAGMLNLLLGANYGYLCGPPAHASALDLFGQFVLSHWPVYILVLEALALAGLGVCYLPFLIADAVRGRLRKVGH